MGLLAVVALVIAWGAWWKNRERLQPPVGEAMRVLPLVVDRAGAMARERGPVPIAPLEDDHDIASAVRILRPAKVEPLPPDAPVGPRRKPRPRSMSPKAVAARRARARQRASAALGITLPEQELPWPDPISLSD